MQEDKEPLFDAMDTARACAGVLPALLRAMTPHPEAMAAALSQGFLLATDLADHLVAQGVPFREAHHVIGRAVAHCLDRECALEDLSLDDLRGLDPRFGDDALSVLDTRLSLERRDVAGGPKPSRVRAAVAYMREQASALGERAERGGPSALERALAAGEPLPVPAS
jgi:argininosuccinate lyase